MTPDIRLAKTEADVRKCWNVFQHLRPNLTEDVYVERMLNMFKEGYSMLYLEVNHQVISAIGYRYLQMLHNGKQIYIDDLTTLPAERGKGHAGVLLEHIKELAISNDCTCVTLDSGPYRHDAHRLYLNKGFIIESYYFEKTLASTA